MSAVRAATAVLGTGAVLLVVGLADASSIAVMMPAAIGRLPPALLVNGGAAAIAYLEGALTRSGALVGAALGVTIYLGAGWEGWLMVFATFACALAASNAGWARKSALGIAEEHRGRRGAPNAVANCGSAAVAALVAITSPHQAAAWLALVAALSAAGADTVASEIGKAWGRKAFLVVGFRPVPPGTSGAVSLEGTAANVAAAAGLGGFGAALGLVPASAVPLVIVSALVGSLVESMLGATLEPRGILDTHELNLINTAIAAAACLSLGHLV